MVAINGDNSHLTVSTSSQVSFFGLNQCPKMERLCIMKDELVQEMECCWQLHDVIMAALKRTNDHKDASLDSAQRPSLVRSVVFASRETRMERHVVL